ncbi:MAG: DUF1566 domain-containing protein, partial [Chromatiales bacterium]|nr:DUF1566 domain-containing protein [Chromatiales bacterium]
LQDTDWTYTWYNTNSTVNGGDVGTLAGGSCGATLAGGCDSSAYIDAINAANLCGHSDWRLPTRKELLQLIDNSVPYGAPSIDQDWFPNATTNWVWSATPSANDTTSAWGVSAGFGSSYEVTKETPQMLRVVRDGL